MKGLWTAKVKEKNIGEYLLHFLVSKDVSNRL